MVLASTSEEPSQPSETPDRARGDIRKNVSASSETRGRPCRASAVAFNVAKTMSNKKVKHSSRRSRPMSSGLGQHARTSPGSCSSSPAPSRSSPLLHPPPPPRQMHMHGSRETPCGCFSQHTPEASRRARATASFGLTQFPPSVFPLSLCLFFYLSISVCRRSVPFSAVEQNIVTLTT